MAWNRIRLGQVPVGKQWLALVMAVATTLSLATSPVSWAKSNASHQAETEECPAQSSRMVCQQVAKTDDGVRIIGAQPDSETVTTILEKVADLQKASNDHDIESVLSYFSPQFVSGDNLTIKDLRQLIEQTWIQYPDIHYTVQPIELRVNGDWATVETLDEAHATAQPSPSSKSEDGASLLPAEEGTLVTQSRGMLYFHRIGHQWEITSDRSLYETAAILYGEARNLNLNLSAPDQVFSGGTYTARIDSELPEGAVAIASITRAPIQFPPVEAEDKFRSMTIQKDRLERVFDANRLSRNELITAVVGLTEVTQTDDNRPTVTFKGLATLTKRVNVSPQAVPQGDDHNGVTPLVRVSADGKVNLRNADSTNDLDEDDTPDSLDSADSAK